MKSNLPNLRFGIYNSSFNVEHIGIPEYGREMRTRYHEPDCHRFNFNFDRLARTRSKARGIRYRFFSVHLHALLSTECSWLYTLFHWFFVRRHSFHARTKRSKHGSDMTVPRSTSIVSYRREGTSELDCTKESLLSGRRRWKLVRIAAAATTVAVALRFCDATHQHRSADFWRIFANQKQNSAFSCASPLPIVAIFWFIACKLINNKS